jgi:hypothetical protein
VSWEPRPDGEDLVDTILREDVQFPPLRHPCADSIEWGRLPPAPAGPLSPTLPPELFAVPADVIDAALSRLPRLDLPLRNFYAPGIYGRELTIPAGTLLTGRRHKAEHLFMVLAGEVTIWGDSVPPEVVRAPFTVVGPPGTRRVGYAHSDVVCTAIFRNPQNLRDPDAILDLWTEVPDLTRAIAALGEQVPLGLRFLLGAGSADQGDHGAREVL